VAIQATGHGVARAVDGDMLIVTKELDEVTVDDDAWTARIGAGVTWGPVLEAAQDVGLAPLLGSTTGVGAIGYTLGGGMGWLARRYGLSADLVRNFEIVTADGIIRLASPEHDQELFWALRGGGAGTLGVVTAMEIDLVPVTDVYAGNLIYPAEMAREVVARYRRWIASAPEELTSSFLMARFPDMDGVPDPLRGGSFVIIRGCHSGPLADGQAAVDEWRQWRTPLVDMFGPMPFRMADTISNDPLDPMPGRATSAWLADIDDAVVDVMIDTVFDPTSPVLLAEVRHAAGAIARGDGSASAYGNRDAAHVLEMVGLVPDAMVVAMVEARFAAAVAALDGHLTGGAYLNFMEGEERRRRSRDGFSPEAWVRLRAAKAHFDPDDVFSHGLDLVG
jgi:FAD/FMN-containing dehydrogenase